MDDRLHLEGKVGEVGLEFGGGEGGGKNWLLITFTSGVDGGNFTLMRVEIESVKIVKCPGVEKYATCMCIQVGRMCIVHKKGIEFREDYVLETGLSQQVSGEIMTDFFVRFG